MSYAGRDLDLRAVSRTDHRYFIGTTKAAAGAMAKKLGWRQSDVKRAANRFQAFWVVGQQLTTDTYRLMCADGTACDVAFAGFF